MWMLILMLLFRETIILVYKNKYAAIHSCPRMRSPFRQKQDYNSSDPVIKPPQYHSTKGSGTPGATGGQHFPGDPWGGCWETSYA